MARARRQLAAAKQIGAEVFVIDAGWYGQGQASQTSWAEQVGDWRENTESAFKGKMAELSQEVRDAGMGFGLWIEPERYCASVPIVKQKPDMFIKSGTFYYPDLTKLEMYGYIVAEISRLIKTYQLVWIKFDFNSELNTDPYRTELYRYYEKWYQLLNDLRRDFPQVFLEGCAGGGGRLDIKSWESFDSYFLSDNVNPLDAIRIHQQLLLRLPPGKIGRWVVLRSVDGDIPSYLPDTPLDTCITPAGNGATWEYFHNTSIEFAVRSAMLGALGFSGDIAGLPNTAKQTISKHVDFYKKWRGFIYGSKTHLLTKPGKKEDHTGWIALFLAADTSDNGLLFAYRLDDARAEYRFCIPRLDPTATYQLKDFDEAGKYSAKITGAELMFSGVTITNKKLYSCSIVEVSKIN
jgi:alpha-galactosidase